MRDAYLPYCRPAVDADDAAAVAATIAGGWLTTGAKAAEFERLFAQTAGVKHAIALNSCTAALHLGLLALDVKPGDEVIVPSLSFVAGANCVVQAGAVPVFCDVERETLCMSVETIKAVVTPRTKAIMTMHYAGRPASAAPIVAFARARNIAVFEDAALAVGMLDAGLWAGTRTDAAAYSFYATKNVTCAEGGMLVTNSDSIADRVRTLSLHGMDRDAWKRYERGGKWRYDVTAVGYKYNMPDVAAVLGLSQWKKLDRHQARREALAARYVEALKNVPGVRPAGVANMQPGDRHGWCMFAIEVDEEEAGISRDSAIDRLAAANVGTSVHYIPSHHFAAYRDRRHSPLPVTDAVWQRLISLPLYPSMTDADADDVIDALASIVGSARTAHISTR